MPVRPRAVHAGPGRVEPDPAGRARAPGEAFEQVQVRRAGLHRGLLGHPGESFGRQDRAAAAGAELLVRPHLVPRGPVRRLGPLLHGLQQVDVRVRVQRVDSGGVLQHHPVEVGGFAGRLSHPGGHDHAAAQDQASAPGGLGDEGQHMVERGPAGRGRRQRRTAPGHRRERVVGPAVTWLWDHAADRSAGH
ncbi:hypothetical protein [Streptomyces sp. 1222.5]|uniref:hypothetical protein n=1 Tax=Streptomyces sp. 1222.5 TaxID=1881026 RepID=UPI003D76262E